MRNVTLYLITSFVLLFSQIVSAGFLDALNDVKKAVDETKNTLEKIPSTIDGKNETEKQQAPKTSKPQASNNSPSNKKTAENRHKNTSHSINDKSLNPDFANVAESVAKIPYQNCPKADIMGIRLGQNIMELADQYRLKFEVPNFAEHGHKYQYLPDNFGAMLFRDAQKADDLNAGLKYPDSGAQVSVYSDKFDNLRHQSIKRQHNYNFSDKDYGQVSESTKLAGRHFLRARFFIKPPKELRDKNYDVAVTTVITDINGDIASLQVARTLPVEINTSDTEAKLKAKYGVSNQVVKGGGGDLSYTMEWSVKYAGKMPRMIQDNGRMETLQQPVSHIYYRMVCHDALRESTKQAKVLLDEVQSKTLSLRKDTSVNVEI